MIVLFDYDSLLYMSSYKIISFGQIRDLYKSMESEIRGKIRLYSSISEVKALRLQGKNRNDIVRHIIEKIIVFEAIGIAENMTLSILEDIEECGAIVDSVEYFLTTCNNSVRKELCSEYKAKRKRNKWVGMIRKEMIAKYNCSHSDLWEADDLIADRAKELPRDNYIICSIDKDLQQIAGLHYNYKQKYEKDKNGKVIKDEFGRKNPIGRKGLSHTSEYQSMCSLAIQMLMGDRGDGIQGIKGIGEVTANKKLIDCKTKISKLKAIIREYKKAFGEDWRTEIIKNYRLLKLGTN